MDGALVDAGARASIPVMQVLVTGAAGFIGFHCTRALLDAGHHVVGVDSLTDYYDPALKHRRLAQLPASDRFAFHHLDCADGPALARLFAAHRFDRVLHLAAQAGVRHSISHPAAYVSANLVGFATLIEHCRLAGVPHLVYASSSSVYGLNRALPAREDQGADHPVSLYAATKRANELMAHAYSHLHRLPTTGLRFFTVYGPWGRPDMAYWSFSERILAGEPITLYNHGRMRRDFTYIDDVVAAVVRVLDHVPEPEPASSVAAADPATSTAPFRLYNLGNSQPVELTRFVRVLEQVLGKPAILRYAEMQPGDVEATAADHSRIGQAVGFTPATPIEVGLARFGAWFLAYRAQQASAVP